MTAATLEVLKLLDKLTGKTTEKAPAKRAAIIQRENSDPATRAAKEQKCKDLIAKWEAWGIL